MKTLSMKSLLGGLMLLAAPAFADSTTSIPAFEAAITTAKSASSPGGTTILRSEIRNALDAFFNDVGYGVDSAERAHLTTRLGDTSFQQSMTGTAAKYFADFYEVNDTLVTGYPLNLYPVAQTPAVLFGATGSFSYARIYEGYIPNGQGVANQQTLGEAFSNAFGPQASIFEPITVRELIGQLSAYSYNEDEVAGAVAYITQISRNSNRLYRTGWSCRGCGAPGYTQGFAIAAVSTDRRFVRMISVTTYAD
ncbi:hypothetical protein [Corallococcus aberystwythensis]|uniref:Uncharacterized protein n=1 Tax=Corallococcus aberystwythensis TaxID=2316722 RepID=A0A3A8QF84_9BACT|nr:hypothetical protein [Corallococcus aberystwythensis]RKH63522.1 hypothetical protein D7W81_20215 [Corallococcus aberystwythensis]